MLLAPLMVLGAPAQPGTVNGCNMTNDFTGYAPDMVCPAVGVDCDFDDTNFDCAACCVLDAVYSVTNWIFFGIALLVTLFIVLGAFNLLTAAGDPTKVDTGKKYILWACIGFVVAISAKSIPYFAQTLIGLK